MGSADDMRDRLRELGRTAPRRVSPELEARLVERLRAEGPAVVRRSHWRRTIVRASAAMLPVALSVTWFAMRDPDAASRVAAAPRASREAEPAKLATNAGVPARECASQASPATEFSDLPGGRRALDLGERGQIVLDRDSEATLRAVDPCRLELQLAAGRVSVHAKRLFGGELRVRAGSADVVVRGTLFAVERGESGMTVDVEEGSVGIERDGEALEPVRAGQSLQLRATQAPLVAALSSEARQQLRAAFSVELPARPSEGEWTAPRRTAKPAAPAKLVARADELWRSGARDEARTRYREAGSGDGPTAEAAWLALARRELSAGDPKAARAALESYNTHFPAGELAAEAAGIDLRAALAARDRARAARIARLLVERYPETPQGAAAARWQREQGAGR